MLVVLDTNIIISGLYSIGGQLRRCQIMPEIAIELTYEKIIEAASKLTHLCNLKILF